jgi:hypothetical protein
MNIQKFSIKFIYSNSPRVHCFAWLIAWSTSKKILPFLVVGGILERINLPSNRIVHGSSICLACLDDRMSCDIEPVTKLQIKSGL